MNPIITIIGPGTGRMRRIAAEEFTREYDPNWQQELYRLLYLFHNPFVWVTHSGDLLDPADMATPHLYYALRMIFNHSVPPEFRTPESLHSVKWYPDVPNWSASYRKAAIDALSNELRTRNPDGLTLAMQDGLRWMAMAARAILNEGI